MRYAALKTATALLLVFCAASLSAQEHPPMTDKFRDAEKERYFEVFTELKRLPSTDSQRKAYEAAIEYLKRFEGDKDSDAQTVREFVTAYERPGRQAEILNSYISKNYAKTLELGRASLEHDKENFLVLSILTQAGMDNAQAGNASLNEATLDHARRAIQLIEAGKVTKTDPFKDADAARGYLNVALGTMLREKWPAEAAKAFRKAVQSDSSYRADPLTHYRLGSAILRGDFARLSKEYSDKYFQKSPSVAQGEMLGRLNTLALQALDAYARAVALSDPGGPKANDSEPGGGRLKLAAELRTKILEQLTSLYKSLHEGSDKGLKELISTVLSRPIP